MKITELFISVYQKFQVQHSIDSITVSSSFKFQASSHSNQGPISPQITTMDKSTVPSMDWLTPGDIHKRFKIFKQKCSLIFNRPLLNKTEGQKARLLLIWASDKGLEIYNTATWGDAADQFKLGPIFDKLEAYTKPQSNQILSRYQLRSLKQDNMLLEEFLTKARMLIDDSGYDPAFQEEALRDTLVFGLKSGKVRKDAISKGNALTFQQLYDLAKTEERGEHQGTNASY